MMEPSKVVVHLVNGTILKGTTRDFFPNRLRFHLLPADGSTAVEVVCKNMKALFFVKSLKGDSARIDESHRFGSKGANSQGKQVAVRFKDGEVLCGYSLVYVDGREGFFMSPASEDTNNLRIYVVHSSAVEVKTGRDAETLARKAEEQKSAAAKSGVTTTPR